jgi:hypothetical protein
MGSNPILKAERAKHWLSEIGMRKMPESAENIELPALDCDILTGYEQVANWRAQTFGQVGLATFNGKPERSARSRYTRIC